MPCQSEVLAVPPFLFDPVPYRGDSAVPFGRFRFDRRHPATTTATAAPALAQRWEQSDGHPGQSVSPSLTDRLPTRASCEKSLRPRSPTVFARRRPHLLRRKAPSTLYASNRASQNSHRLDSRAGTDANRLLRRRDGEDCAQDSSFGASEPFGSSQACNGDVHTTPAGRRGRPRADATDNQCHATSVPFRGFGGLAPGRLVHREAELLPTCTCSQTRQLAKAAPASLDACPAGRNLTRRYDILHLPGAASHRCQRRITSRVVGIAQRIATSFSQEEAAMYGTALWPVPAFETASNDVHDVKAMCRDISSLRDAFAGSTPAGPACCSPCRLEPHEGPREKAPSVGLTARSPPVRRHRRRLAQAHVRVRDAILIARLLGVGRVPPKSTKAVSRYQEALDMLHDLGPAGLWCWRKSELPICPGPPALDCVERALRSQLWEPEARAVMVVAPVTSESRGPGS
ncbi:hypothetical protein Purlil1_7392 [Purpureocillium lilacinum]|uniref:Uncharacterized protein n=1 Tax=Purpureocillium lilacinum TaxID=33203 RepID=A0ABR0BVR7_PURLI|nr:hypothetical protein Purlil1_7392 [Purpureocillium lilacinum]